MAARLDKIERAAETQGNDPALASRIAELAAQSKALGDSVAALTRRVDEIAAASQGAGKQADTALNAAAAAKSASEAASKDQMHREDVDALANRIMALESAVKGLAAATAPLASSGADDRTARLTIAAEGKDCRVSLDLKELTLTGQDGMSFLAQCEAEGIVLVNCDPYVREWIARHKGVRHKGVT